MPTQESPKPQEKFKVREEVLVQSSSFPDLLECLSLIPRKSTNISILDDQIELVTYYR